MRRWLILFFAICAVSAAALHTTSSVRAESATQVFATENCFGDRASVRLSWLGLDSSATELSLDLSYQDNGFRAGTFRSSGAMSADRGSVVWDDLPGGRTYFVRLNQ